MYRPVNDVLGHVESPSTVFFSPLDFDIDLFILSKMYLHFVNKKKKKKVKKKIVKKYEILVKYTNGEKGNIQEDRKKKNRQ